MRNLYTLAELFKVSSAEIFNVNPLTPSWIHKSSLTKILFIKYEGIIKKILWASRLWVGRRKEPILGFVQKND